MLLYLPKNLEEHFNFPGVMQSEDEAFLPCIPAELAVWGLGCSLLSYLLSSSGHIRGKQLIIILMPHYCEYPSLMRRRKKKWHWQVQGRILWRAARTDAYASGCLRLFVDMVVAQPANLSSKVGWIVKIEHQLFPVSVMTIMCLFARHRILIEQFEQHCRTYDYQEMWHALDPFSEQ